MGLLITIINAFVTVLTITVVIYTLLRFFLDPYHPAIRAMGHVIDPILMPIQRLVPPMGGFDFSPLILIIAIQVLGTILIALLRGLL